MRRRPFVLLPPSGLRWPSAGGPSAGGSGGGSIADGPGPVGTLAHLADPPVVLDTLVPPGRGATLVSLGPGGAEALRRAEPGLRVLPVRRYRPAVARPEVLTRPPSLGPSGTYEVRVVSARDARPLAGVLVMGFTDFAARHGDRAVTGPNGTVRLRVGGAALLERLYTFGAIDHWSLLRRRVPIGPDIELRLRPFDHRAGDGLSFRYGLPRLGAGAGVRVAVVDTGIDLEHADLTVAGGRNCVTGEEPAQFGSNGEPHGSHVAGIIAATGHPPTGRRGVAPGAEVLSYRVFGEGEGEATNFAIAKAVDAAVEDGCDIVNLSLGGGAADPVVRAAIEEAQAAGVVVVAAAGNDGRRPVVFPADLPDVVAVAAVGRTGTYPPDAAGSAERRGPYGDDGADYVAAFSNVGEVDVAAPGVAIVSTVPGGYLDMDGTSMACPAVTGVVARVLAGHRRLRSRPAAPSAQRPSWPSWLGGRRR